MGTGTQSLRDLRGRVRVLSLALLLLPLQAEKAAAGALERAMLGKSAVVDLTHALNDRPPSLPGQERPRPEGPPEVDRTNAGPHIPALESLATHLDLPASIVKGKPTVAQIPARELLALAVVVDIVARVELAVDYRLTADDIRRWEQRNGRIPKGSMVLLHTGWARRWSDPARYLNLDPQGEPRVPGFSPGAIAFLVKERDIRGVGLDSWVSEGASGGTGEDGGARSLLQAGKWQLVNLTNLDRLPAKGAKLVIAPLRLDAGSAPARVIAILP